MKVLIVGSGPITIGQAAEFDYAGTQACRALREEGIETVLVNSNPATIMTDPGVADATYIEPLTVEVLERIIAKERPDGLLPTLGGQTGLNLRRTCRGGRPSVTACVFWALRYRRSSRPRTARFQELLVGIGSRCPSPSRSTASRGIVFASVWVSRCVRPRTRSAGWRGFATTTESSPGTARVGASSHLTGPHRALAPRGKDRYEVMRDEGTPETGQHGTLTPWFPHRRLDRRAPSQTSPTRYQCSPRDSAS